VKWIRVASQEALELFQSNPMVGCEIVITQYFNAGFAPPFLSV
jgi:hypothetical protein